MCRAIRDVDSPPDRRLHSSSISASVSGFCFGPRLRFTAHLLARQPCVLYMRCCVDPLSRPSPMRVWGQGLQEALLGIDFRLCPDLDLLPCYFEPVRADLEIDPSLVDRLQRILPAALPVFEELELLVQLLERLLVGQVLAQESTSSIFAPRRPVPRRIRTLRSTPVASAVRTTAPVSAPSGRL